MKLKIITYNKIPCIILKKYRKNRRTYIDIFYKNKIEKLKIITNDPIIKMDL